MIRCITGTSILILGLGLVFLTRQNALEPVKAKVAPIDTMKREALVNAHRESATTIPLSSGDKAEPEVDRIRDNKVVEGLQRIKEKTAHILLSAFPRLQLLNLDKPVWRPSFALRTLETQPGCIE